MHKGFRRTRLRGTRARIRERRQELTRSLRSLVGSRFPPKPNHKQATNKPSRPDHSLASLARGLLVPSAAPPNALRFPRSLRSLGLPASCVQGEPLHFVVRVSEKVAPSHIPPSVPYSLVLRAAARLMLAVGLLATPSDALAFRALCRRASLP